MCPHSVTETELSHFYWIIDLWKHIYFEIIFFQKRARTVSADEGQSEGTQESEDDTPAGRVTTRRSAASVKGL